jgi:hypothetical protein
MKSGINEIMAWDELEYTMCKKPVGITLSAEIISQTKVGIFGGLTKICEQNGRLHKASIHFFCVSKSEPAL